MFIKLERLAMSMDSRFSFFVAIKLSRRLKSEPFVASSILDTLERPPDFVRSKSCPFYLSPSLQPDESDPESCNSSAI
jgi:hypothetical protein